MFDTARITWKQLDGTKHSGRCVEVDSNVGIVDCDDGVQRAVELSDNEILRFALAGIPGATENDVDEITKTKNIARIPLPFVTLGKDKNRKPNSKAGRRLVFPGSRSMFDLPRLLPQSAMSRFGKIRRKKHRRKDRNRRFVGFAELF